MMRICRIVLVSQHDYNGSIIGTVGVCIGGWGRDCG